MSAAMFGATCTAQANLIQFCGGGRSISLKWSLPPITVINPPLLPLPEITDKPPCELAELCSTTVTHSETLVRIARSTVTETSSYCATVYGCAPTGWELSTTTTATACPLPTTPTDGTFKPPPFGYPENVSSIPSPLQGYDDYVEVGLSTDNWVMFYWIPMLGQDTMDALRQSPDVSYAYYYKESNYNIGAPFALEEEFLDWDLPSYPKAPPALSELKDRMSSDKLPVTARQETDTEPRVWHG
ncbi:hypothetical protein BJX99DRAFT_252482 [Aspergillus californicus]